MANPEHIAGLLFRYLRKELTAPEVEELQAWRHETPEQEQLFQKLTNEEELPRLLKAYYDRREMIWEKIVEQSPELAHKNARKLWTWRTIAAAAILIVAIGITYILVKRFTDTPAIDTKLPVAVVKQDIAPGTNKAILTLADGTQLSLGKETVSIPLQGSSTVQQSDSGWLQYSAKDGGVIARNTLTTPRGGQYNLTLPDGTRVWLNAASSLSYPTQFPANERTVELSGEAYFEVAKNAASPFHVLINNHSEVTVLGTHFNIMAYPDEPLVSTTLLEGSVKYQGIMLKPGEQARLLQNGELIKDKDVDVNEAVAWKNGFLNFSDADIPTIMRIIARWYDIEIVYAGKIPERKFVGGIPRNSPLSDVLKVLDLYNVHYTLEGKVMTIRP